MAYMAITLSLFIIAIIIVFGLIAKLIFSKYKVPDVMLLILLGTLLSHFGLTGGLDLGSPMLSVLITIALIYVVFNGALPIKIRAVFSSAKWAFVSAILNFIAITTGVTLVSFMFGFELKMALTLGMLLCVMDGSIINSILEIVKFSKRAEAFIQVESAFVDIIVIVAIVAMINIQEISLQTFMQQIVNFIFLSSAIGVAFALGWASLAKKIGTRNHLSIATIAMLLLVYVFAEQFSANGVITIFAFAITIGNLKILSKVMYKKDQESIEPLSAEQKHFFSDFSFILRTLLFVFIGTLVDLQIWKYLLLGLLLVIIAYIIRSFIFKIVYTGDIPLKDILMMKIMGTKGMTPVVLISLIAGSTEFTNTIIGAIFFSVLLTAIAIPIIERGHNPSISRFISSGFKKKTPQLEQENSL